MYDTLGGPEEERLGAGCWKMTAGQLTRVNLHLPDRIAKYFMKMMNYETAPQAYSLVT